MNEVTLSNDLGLLIYQFVFEINYVDYPEDQYTRPVHLTPFRAEKLLNDYSIRKIRFTHVFGGISFTFGPESLIYTK